MPDGVILAMVQAPPAQQIDQNESNDPIEKPEPPEKSCKQSPWPSGQIWDIGSLAYDSSRGFGNEAAVQLLTNTSKYYLLSNLPEEGDPPIGWWTKVTCPQGADIWVFAKKHPQYFSPFQPNTKVYHILITSPQPGGWMVYNHMFTPEGSLWTPLVQAAGRLRDSSAKQIQKQLNKQRKEDEKKRRQQ